jgi:hypothetical protein
VPAPAGAGTGTLVSGPDMQTIDARHLAFDSY